MDFQYGTKDRRPYANIRGDYGKSRSDKKSRIEESKRIEETIEKGLSYRSEEDAGYCVICSQYQWTDTPHEGYFYQCFECY